MKYEINKITKALQHGDVCDACLAMDEVDPLLFRGRPFVFSEPDQVCDKCNDTPVRILTSATWDKEPETETSALELFESWCDSFLEDVGA